MTQVEAAANGGPKGGGKGVPPPCAPRISSKAEYLASLAASKEDKRTQNEYVNVLWAATTKAPKGNKDNLVHDPVFTALGASQDRMSAFQHGIHSYRSSQPRSSSKEVKRRQRSTTESNYTTKCGAHLSTDKKITDINVSTRSRSSSPSTRRTEKRNDDTYNAAGSVSGGSEEEESGAVTIWGENDGLILRRHSQTICEALFKKSKPVRENGKRRGSEEGQDSTEPKSVLEKSLVMILELYVKMMKMLPDEVIRHVMNILHRGPTGETLEEMDHNFLIDIIKTCDRDGGAIKKLLVGQAAIVGPAFAGFAYQMEHRLLYQMVTTENFIRRAECLVFTSEVHDALSGLDKKTDLLIRGLNVLDSKTDQLKQFLNTAKEFGNCMNQGTNKTISRGFKMSSLRKLWEARPTVEGWKGVSIFHFIVLNSRIQFTTKDEKTFNDAKGHAYSILTEQKRITEQCEGIKRFIGEHDSNRQDENACDDGGSEDDGFFMFLEEFSDKIQEKIDEVKDSTIHTLLRIKEWALFLDDLGSYWPPAPVNEGKMDLFEVMSDVVYLVKDAKEALERGKLGERLLELVGDSLNDMVCGGNIECPPFSNVTTLSSDLKSSVQSVPNKSTTTHKMTSESPVQCGRENSDQDESMRQKKSDDRNKLTINSLSYSRHTGLDKFPVIKLPEPALAADSAEIVNPGHTAPEDTTSPPGSNRIDDDESDEKMRTTCKITQTFPVSSTSSSPGDGKSPCTRGCIQPDVGPSFEIPKPETARKTTIPPRINIVSQQPPPPPPPFSSSPLLQQLSMCPQRPLANLLCANLRVKAPAPGGEKKGSNASEAGPHDTGGDKSTIAGSKSSSSWSSGIITPVSHEPASARSTDTNVTLAHHVSRSSSSHVPITEKMMHDVVGRVNSSSSESKLSPKSTHNSRALQGQQQHSVLMTAEKGSQKGTVNENTKKGIESAKQPRGSSCSPPPNDREEEEERRTKENETMKGGQVRWPNPRLNLPRTSSKKDAITTSKTSSSKDDEESKDEERSPFIVTPRKRSASLKKEEVSTPRVEVSTPKITHRRYSVQGRYLTRSSEKTVCMSKLRTMPNEESKLDQRDSSKCKRGRIDEDKKEASCKPSKPLTNAPMRKQDSNQQQSIESELEKHRLSSSPSHARSTSSRKAKSHLESTTCKKSNQHTFPKLSSRSKLKLDSNLSTPELLIKEGVSDVLVPSSGLEETGKTEVKVKSRTRHSAPSMHTDSDNADSAGFAITYSTEGSKEVADLNSGLEETSKNYVGGVKSKTRHSAPSIHTDSVEVLMSEESSHKSSRESKCSTRPRSQVVKGRCRALGSVNVEGSHVEETSKLVPPVKSRTRHSAPSMHMDSIEGKSVDAPHKSSRESKSWTRPRSQVLEGRCQVLKGSVNADSAGSAATTRRRHSGGEYPEKINPVGFREKKNCPIPKQSFFRAGSTVEEGEIHKESKEDTAKKEKKTVNLGTKLARRTQTTQGKQEGKQEQMEQPCSSSRTMKQQPRRLIRRRRSSSSS